MAGLDFKRGTDLFMGSEEELALALDVSVGDVLRYRRAPATAPPAVLTRLGVVLVERGRGMIRAGEILQGG